MANTHDIFSYVKSHVAILDVVQEYVSLKRSGSYWKGYSPFRAEHIPSFTVSPDKGIYYCFSTNIGGDVIHFVAHMENCSQYEAAQHLIEQYQLQPPQENQHEHDEKKQYHLACSIFATWCHKQLHAHSRPQQYVEHRGFSHDIISAFQIGYCPPRKQLLRTFIPFARKHGVSHDDLISAHIIKNGTYGPYSPFEDRIIFPIANHLGHICGFGGRIIDPNDQRAKYYNSQDHPYFRKGKLLYNLSSAKTHLQHHEQLYLVEGYTDCIAMAAAGYHNTVATLGTACSKEHLSHIARHTHKLCVLYDGDTAGQNALLRLTHLCWDVDLELSVVPLAEKEDPATLRDAGHLEYRLTQQYDIFQYYIQRMGSEFLQKPLRERIHAARNVFQTITKLNDTLKKDMLLQHAAQTFDIPFETLYRELSGAKKAHPHRTPQPQSQYMLEKCILYAALFHDVNLTREDIDYIRYFLPDRITEIFDQIIQHKNRAETFNFDAFFAKLDDKEQRIISKITAECEPYMQHASLHSLLQQFYKKKWKEVINRVKSHAHTRESNEYQAALHDLYALKEYMVRRGLVWQPKSEKV